MLHDPNRELLALVRLDELMARTAGRPEVAIGLIDGPVALDHPDLAASHVRLVGARPVTCGGAGDAACSHGTFVAGILAARRGSPAPALCPDCTVLARPLFTPQCGDGPCTCGCGGKGAAAAPLSFVYALGRIEPRFPRVSVERELAQAIGRDQTSGLTDRAALHQALANPANRYLVRQLCWVLTIEGLDTYLLQPRNPGDFDLLVEALRPTPRSTDVDLVIGIRGPVAPPDLCNGLMVPIVVFDQIYSFSDGELLDAIPRPEGVEEERYRSTLEEVFSRVRQIADNAGAADEHRALNYLAVRYPAVYSRTADYHERNWSLTGLEVRPSTLGTTRKIVDVIFTYTHRTNDVAEKQFVRVDVTDEFPFLTTKLSPYFDR